MSKPQPSRAPTHGQLCVIAKEQLETEPSISDGEWKARIKDRLVRLRFDSPETSEPIHRAMSAVEKAYEKQHGPRRIPLPPRSPTTQEAATVPLTPAEVTTFLHQVSASSSPRSSTFASNSGLTPLSSLIDGSVSRAPGSNRSTEQIAEWRASTPKPQWKQTSRGWQRVREGR